MVDVFVFLVVFFGLWGFWKLVDRLTGDDKRGGIPPGDPWF